MLHTEDITTGIPVTTITTSNIYYPQLNDIVIGKVYDKTFDYYSIHCNAPDLLVLHSLDFEGATKKNKPEIEIG